MPVAELPSVMRFGLPRLHEREEDGEGDDTGRQVAPEREPR